MTDVLRSKTQVAVLCDLLAAMCGWAESLAGKAGWYRENANSFWTTYDAARAAIARSSVETADDELARVRQNHLAHIACYPPICCAGSVAHEPNCPQLAAVKTTDRTTDGEAL